MATLCTLGSMSKTPILFGFNGSLIDIDEIASKCFKEVFENEFKRELPNLKKFFYPQNTVLNMYPDLDQMKLLKFMKAFSDKLRSQLDKVPFEQSEILDRYSSEYKFQLISSFPNEVIFNFLEEHRVLKFFDMVLGCNDFEKTLLPLNYYQPLKSMFEEKITFIHQDPLRLLQGKKYGMQVLKINDSREIENYLLNPK